MVGYERIHKTKTSKVMISNNYTKTKAVTEFEVEVF